MNSLLSEEQAALEQACRKLLEKEWPLEKAVKVLGTEKAGHSPELWRTLVDAGWLGLPFSPDVGGAGGDLIDLGLVYRAAGERLVPASFYACMFAALLIDRIGGEAGKLNLLPSIIAGERIATVAYSEPQAPENQRFFTTVARRTGHGWVLNGGKAFVPSLDIADIVLVLARTRANGDRSGLGSVRGSGRRTVRRCPPDVELRLRIGCFELRLDEVALPTNALLGGDDALATTLWDFEDVVEQATALQCMEMAGGTATVLTRTIDYVGDRSRTAAKSAASRRSSICSPMPASSSRAAASAALRAVFEKAKGRAAARDRRDRQGGDGRGLFQRDDHRTTALGRDGLCARDRPLSVAERAKVTDAWFGTRASHLRVLSTDMGL